MFFSRINHNIPLKEPSDNEIILLGFAKLWLQCKVLNILKIESRIGTTITVVMKNVKASLKTTHICDNIVIIMCD